MAKLFLGGGSAVFCLVVIIVVVFVENKKNIQQKFDVFIAEIAVCGLWAIIIAVGYKWKGVVHPDFSNGEKTVLPSN